MAPQDTPRNHHDHAPSTTALGTLAAFVSPWVPWAAAVVLFLHWYGHVDVFPGPWETPFDHLHLPLIPAPRMLAGGALLVVMLVLVQRARRETRFGRRSLVAVIGVTAILWALRQREIVLGDGPNLLRDPVAAVLSGGYYTFLDELLGMWLPLRLARVRLMEGVPVVEAITQGYQLVSLASGALLAAVVARTSRGTVQPATYATLLLGNAALLLCAGYVENYSAANALLATVFLVSADRLRHGRAGGRTVLFAALLCALAVLFHGVAVWSVFALAVLPWAAGRGRWRSVLGWSVAAGLVGLATLGVAIGVFRQWITPGVSFVHVRSTAETLASFRDVLEHRPSHEHIAAFLRVNTPALVLGVTALAFHPVRTLHVWRRADAVFAWLWLAGFLVHQSLWKSTLGVARDWDLFGFTWLPSAYLAWRAHASTQHSALGRAAVLPLAWFGGFAWVLRWSGL